MIASFVQRLRAQFEAARSEPEVTSLLESLVTSSHTVGAFVDVVPPACFEQYVALVGGHLGEEPIGFAAKMLPVGTLAERRVRFVKTVKELIGVSSTTPAVKKKWVAQALRNPFSLEVARACAVSTPVTRFQNGLAVVLLEDGSHESLDALMPWVTEALKRGGHLLEVFRQLASSKRVKAPELKALLVPRISRQ